MKQKTAHKTDLEPFLLTTREAASFMRLSVNGLRNLVEKGEIARVKLGHRVLFRRDELIEYVEKRTERVRRIEDLTSSASG